jgi:predicted dehydrogenase
MKKSLSRRRFLQASAVFGAPLILPSGMWGASQKGVGPNSRINVGLIGIGRRTTGIASALSESLDAQMVAVSDCVDARLEHGVGHLKKLYKKQKRASDGVRAHRNFRAIIEDKSIDGVVIGTPDHWHAVMAVMAAKAGKHIYCEKPLTRTIGEGRAVVKAARENNIVFQTGSQQRTEYGGKFRTAVEYVRSGRIGDLKKIYIGVGGPPVPDNLPDETLPTGIDWEMWLGPAPQRGFNEVLCPIGIHKHFPQWRQYREYAGGSLSDIGAHHFDIAQWAMDEDSSGPVSVVPPQDSQGTQGLSFKYRTGIEMVHGKEMGRRGCVFVGTKGEIYVDRSVLESTPGTILEQPLEKGDFHLPRVAKRHQFDWLECVRSGAKPVADVEIGHRTNTVCMLANLGYRLNRELRWDPVAEVFVGDDEANGLISQPDRSPWAGIAV